MSDAENTENIPEKSRSTHEPMTEGKSVSLWRPSAHRDGPSAPRPAPEVAPPPEAPVLESTDVHRSKVSPDSEGLQLERPQSRKLRKSTVTGLTIAAGAVTLFAILGALQPPKPRTPEGEREGRVAGAQAPRPNAEPPQLPAAIIAPPPPRFDDPQDGAGLAGGPEDVPRLPTDSDVQEPSRYGRAASKRQGQRGVPPPVLPPEGGSGGGYGDMEAQAAAQEEQRALSSGILANTSEDPAGGDTRSPGLSPGGGSSSGAAMPGGLGGGAGGKDEDPNLQARKEGFLAGGGARNAVYSSQQMLRPLSPYEVKAGTIISGALETGINSDLPGLIKARVTQNVYDTVSGNYLLIPQGSTLLASYDSMVAYGQERVLLCWNRLIRPDGTSISLECMPGVDGAGYSGVKDQVDNHWGKFVTGVIMSTLLSVGTQAVAGDVQGYHPTLGQRAAMNAAQEVQSAGQAVVRRNLNIQPTLTVRPGFRVNVLVSKDLIIPPYRAGAAP